MKLNVFHIVRGALRAGVLGAAVALAACGGGEQVQTFTATRVIVFGDESSTLTADGRKYTVNALAAGSSTQFDCTLNPVWVQALAAGYGLAFPQCAGLAPAPNGRIYAANGATVADVTAQIDDHLTNGGGFVDGDLATVYAGANDVIAEFMRYPGVGEAQLGVNVSAAGRALAQQVNRVATLGAKVLIVTIPDLGRTPFAGDRSAGSTDGNPALLTRLSTLFNDALLAGLLNDGHKIGLVQLDQYLTSIDNAVINNIGGSGFSNTTRAACAVALPNCSTGTLVPDADNATWLWADDRHLGAGGQTSLGSLALSRARSNPF